MPRHESIYDQKAYSLLLSTVLKLAGELRRIVNIVGLLVLGTVILVTFGVVAANRKSEPGS